jgi:hypothetical protein
MSRHLFLTILIYTSLISCTSNDSSTKKDYKFIHESTLLDQIRKETKHHLFGDTIEFQENLLISEMKVLWSINDSIDIFSIPIQGHPIRKDYILCVASNKNLYSSIRLNGNWINNDEFEDSFIFLSKPLIYAKDITNNGMPELIIKDRQHNGNMYNAAVKHIYSLSDLKIRYIGKFEYVSYLPFEDEYLIRFWDGQSNNVEVYLKKSLHTQDSIKVGSYKLEIKEGSLYHYDVSVDFKEFEDYKHLLTSSGIIEIW